MNDDIWDEYEKAINSAWLKIGAAQTNEEIQEVLDTWPKQEEFCKEEKDEPEEND